MAQRATSLGPKPSLFFGFCFLFVVFFGFFFVVFLVCVFLFLFFGGFKGQVRWPKGPPHLALNPPYLFFCFFFFPLPFLYLFFNRKTLFSPLKKAIFVYLSVFPFCFSLALFWPPPFFPFSFFVSLLLFSFFLPSSFLISLSGSLFFLLFGLLLGSRCYVVFLFLRVVFFCLWSFFLFCFCCFVLNFVFFCFSFLSKKDPQKKTGHSKNQKKQKCRKKGQKKMLAQLCSQIVFFNFLGWT